MPQYQSGKTTRFAHVALPAGTVEEEHGREGFFGAVSHLYHLHPPTGWTSIDGPLRPRAFHATDLPAPGDERALPVELLVNDEVRLSLWHRTTELPFFFRNADGDDVLFCHRGSGTFETDYGPLTYGQGDYVVLPRGTTYRVVPTAPSTFYCIQTTDGVRPPDRGLLGPNAIWDESCLRIPEAHAFDEAGDFEVVIKRQGLLTSVRYPFHPLDVVGWKGDLTPFVLSIDDIRPIVAPGYHLPPSVHTTFQADGAVICTFLPRPLESDPEALSVPFFHRNIDYDETIFYHDGDFFSRDGIEAGSLTWHPQGIHHGPHPKALANMGTKEWTDEKAVMIDARKPLEMTEAAESVEWSEYWATWQG